MAYRCPVAAVHRLGNNSQQVSHMNQPLSIAETDVTCAARHHRRRVCNLTSGSSILCLVWVIMSTILLMQFGKAVSLVQDMVRGGLQPDQFTFTAILNACQRANEAEVAFEVFR